MQWVADLHLHSHYSRATSGALTLPALHRSALAKGIQLVGTGDFTHPGWRTEIREQLEPAEPGLWRLRPELRRQAERDLPPACQGEVRFILQVEISSIYTHGNRTRKNHNLVFVPSFEAAERLVERLERIGNLSSDGRPILGLDARDLLETVLETDPDAFLVPAHIWTPWFSLLGSKSGFDSLDQCFRDLAPEIFAAETGLSSDPSMNWRVSALDRLTLISNSDAHSPDKLGREANLLEGELAYGQLLGALRTGVGFAGTLEFYPEEGKYHLDGHRKCEVRLEPEETRELRGRCPRCGEQLTVGVLSRVVELSDRPAGCRPERAAAYQCLVPLDEVVGETLGVGAQSKRAKAVRESLLKALGPELGVLRTVPLEEIRRVGGAALEEAVRRVRAGELVVEPGYDGEYGTVRLFAQGERDRLAGQMLLGGADRAPPSPRPRARDGSGVDPVGRICAEAAATSVSPPSDVRQGLDGDQLRAASWAHGPLLVVAGPGTGKTRTLVARVLEQVEHGGVLPERVLAITFTRQAALELEQRLGEAMMEQRLRATTFHGFGRWLIEQHCSSAVTVADDDTRLELLGTAAQERAQTLTPKQVGEQISFAKQSLVPERVLADRPFVLAAFQRYQALLAQRNLFDLDDLVLRAVGCLEEDPGFARAVSSRLGCVVVDEYQDVSDVQARLVELIAPTGRTLCAIGDPDQAIYGFRGARPGHFSRFAQSFPGTRQIELGTSYRLTRPVLRVALAVLGAERRLEAVEDGPKVELVGCPTPASEAEQVVVRLEELLGGTSSFAVDSGRAQGRALRELGFGDVAVLTRTKTQLREFVRALGESGIPCRLVAEDEPHDPRAQKIALMTMHAAKGREFKVVFVAGVEEGLVPLSLPGFSVDPAEEQRLLYVAITRARHLCVLSYANQRVVFGQSLPGRASRWLTGLPLDAVAQRLPELPRHRKRSRQLGLFG